MKLNLGCGKDWKTLYPDYIGLDILDYGQKYQCDVMAFNTSEKFDEVMANHFLEHFDVDELRIIFNKVYDWLKMGGLFRITVPHKDRDKAWVLPHKTFFTESTFTSLADCEEGKKYEYGSWEIVDMVKNHKLNIHVTLKKI